MTRRHLRHLRHLLAPLAVAAMLLGLASNAAAQGPGGVPEYSTFPAAQVFTVGVEITPVTLPAANGGDAPLTYTLHPTVPGLTLNPTSRVLTGTPTMAAVLASYFIRATDVDDETTQINFNITVNPAANTVPTGLTLSLDPATVTESADATTITVTATLVGGTFAENRSVLFASTATGSTATVDTDYTRVPTITTLTILAGQPSGTETFAFTAVADTVAEPAGETVVIEGGVVLPGELNLDTSIPVTTATITINDPSPTDTAPSFGGATVDDQNYIIGQLITPLTLPAATGGNGRLAYSLNPVVPGLTFNSDSSSRVLTGTPTTAGSATRFYRVIDDDQNFNADDRDTITFTITVEAGGVPTGVTLSVNPATVTESADATTITVTATVDGGTFTVERVVGFSTAGSGGGSTATQNDYTSVGFTPLTIPANMASASTTIEFTAAVDAVAEPAGETVVIEGILQLPNSQTADTSIPVTSATITINDPVANIAPIYSSVIFGSLSYVQNRMISPTTLPAVTTPGNGDTVYSMAVLPAGLTFDAATRAIIGTPTVAVVQTSYDPHGARFGRR